jgi:hypothetical protein
MTVGVVNLVIEIPEPVDWQTGQPTSREDWVRGVSEAALHGMRSWMHGAQVTCEPTLYVNTEVVPKDPPR